MSTRPTLPQADEIGALVPIGRIAKATPYSADFLRQLARSGKLRAYKLNSDWLTTPAAVSEYLKSQTKRHEKALSLLQTAEKAFLALAILLMVVSITPKADAQELNMPPTAHSVVLSTLHEITAVWQQFSAFYGQQFAVIGTQANHALLSFGEVLTGKTTEEYLADAPAPKLIVHSRGIAANTSTSHSAEAVPQVLGVSIAQPAAQSETPATPMVAPRQIQNLIDQTLQRYLASGKFIGPQGPQGPAGQNSSGLVQGSNGQSTAIIGGTPIVTYIPASNNNNFTGGSVAGFTNLSSQSFSAVNQIVTGQLTVSGSANFTGGLTAATSTLSALTVSGPVNLTGSTTIAGLTVTGFNPGLTLGSVAFQGATSLAQDNSNLFYDSGNHRLGIGTSTPSQPLTVVGSSYFNGKVGIGSSSPVATLSIQGSGVDPMFNVASSSGASALYVSNTGNGGIGTTTPAFALDVNGTVNAANLQGSGGGIINLSAANITSSSQERNSFGGYFLPHLFSKLALIQKGVASTSAVVVNLGDSWTANHRIGNAETTAMQNQFGDGGFGYWSWTSGENPSPYLGCSYTINNGTWTDQTNVSSSYGLDLSQENTVDFSTPASRSLNCSRPVSSFKIWYLAQPNGASFNWQVDGATGTCNGGGNCYGTINTAAGSVSVQSVVITTDITAAHSVSIVIGGSGSAGITILGVDIRRNDVNGVRVYQLGHGGSKVSDWNTGTAFNTNWASQLADLNPDVVTLRWGVNEQNQNITPTTYQTNLSTFLATVKAAVPNADCIITTPTEVNAAAPTYTMSQYAAAAQNVARQNNCAFIDNTKIISTSSLFTSLGINSDNFHLNDQGGQLVANTELPILTQGLQPLLSINQSSLNTLFYGNNTGALTTGTNNTAFGSNIMPAVTTGNGNTAMGNYVMNTLTSGSNLTAIGDHAMQLVTTATSSVAVGYYSLGALATGGTYTGSLNTAIGYQSLMRASSATNNTCGGYNSCTSVSTGGKNSGWGSIELNLLTTGTDNTGIGYAALYRATSSSFSTGIGDLALYNTTGGYNTSLGYYAGGTQTTGTSVISLGYYAGGSAPANISNALLVGDTQTNAGVYDGYFGGYSGSSPHSFTFHATGGSGTNVAGANLLLAGGIGTGNSTSGDLMFQTSDATSSGATLQSLSTKMIIKGSGNVGIGTTTPTLGPLTMASGAYVTAGGTWTNASDRNLKEGFVTVTPEDILRKINQLPITEWNYKSEGPLVKHIGPVAQDFYALFQVGNSSASISTIDPSGIALLGIQALDQKIAALQGAMTGNATASNLSVYVPSNFSGDSVGEAKILAGQMSVRVSFRQPYAEQPIVVADVLSAFVQHAIDNVDASGFEISMPAATSTDVTFTWHSFASPQAQLSVSDGTTHPIHLAVVPSVGTAPVVPPPASTTSPEVLATTTPAIAVDATTTPIAVQTPSSDAPTASTTPVASAPAPTQDAPPQTPEPLIVVTAPSPDAGLTPTAPSNAQN